MLGFGLGLGQWVSGPGGSAGLAFSFSSSFRLGCCEVADFFPVFNKYSHFVLPMVEAVC
ncbi:hypothetical protein RchiOBHm_Chr1g0317131 [Rosa chinensis]|uniref:Uncharacterized protein n=1 Tax=Rosa chinensis TaxID=74649 RepID=A0A2P6S7T6_ROSCH|nr:hypothetical protein RchiOBHm_Chr1g0317131 [Rosa chinensis]